MSENLVVENRVKAIEEDVERNKNAHKEFYDRLAALEITLAKMSVEYQNIMAALTIVQADTKEIKEKPGKRWDNIANTVLQWAVLGLLASTVLLK